MAAVLLFLLIFCSSLLLTETGLRILLSQCARVSGLRLDGVHGRLYGPFRIDHVRLDGLNQIIELTDLRIDWQPSALLQGALHVKTIDLKNFSITRKIEQHPTVPALPEQIAFPLRLQIDHLFVSGGALSKGPLALVRFGAIGLKLDFDGARYLLALDQLAAQGGIDAAGLNGSLTGHATLAVRKPYALQAAFSSSAKSVVQDQPVAATGQLTLAGSLAQISAVVDLTVRQTHFFGQARLRPFSALPLVQAALRAEAVDLAALQAGWPQTRLALQLDAAENGTGRLTLANPAAGTSDIRRLPLTSLLVDFAQQDDRFLLKKISVALGTTAQSGGTIGGTGVLQNGALQLALNIAKANLQQIDRRINPTYLDGTVMLQHAAGTQQITMALREPGKRNPLRLSAHATLADAALAVDRAELRVADSAVSATGALALSGTQGFQFNGRLTRFRLQDVGQFAQLPSLELNGAFSLRGARVPHLAADLSFQINDSVLEGRPLRGAGEAHLRGDAMQIPNLVLRAGDNQLRLHGALAKEHGELIFTLQAPRLEQLGTQFGGALAVSGTVRGTFRQPHALIVWDGNHLHLPQALQVAALHGKADVSFSRQQAFSLDSLTLDATASGVKSADLQLDDVRTQIGFSARPEAPLAIMIKGQGASAAGVSAQHFEINASGSTAQHALVITMQDGQQMLRIGAHGGLAARQPDVRWQGQLDSLQASGTHTATLIVPARLSVAQQRVALEGMTIDVDGMRLTVTQFVRDAAGIVTQGRFAHLAVAPLLRLLKPAAPIRADLALGGEWQLHIADVVSGHLAVQRETGDLVVQGTSTVPLGLNQLQLTAEAVDGRLVARLQAAGRQLGQVDMTARASSGRGAARFALVPTAPLDVNVNIDVPSLQWVGPLLSPSVVTAGHLHSAIRFDGTLVQPRLNGTLAGDNLRIFWADQGIDLQHGVLDSVFEGERLLVRALHFESGAGTLHASGPINLTAGQPTAQVALVANHFALLNRSDRTLVMSGSSEIDWYQQRARINGKFHVDSGSFDLGREDAPQLSDDVVIVGRVSKSSGRMVAAIDVGIDLGDGVSLTGRGLDARINGALRLTSSGTDGLRGQGTLTVVQGSYAAYGRKLAIEQGLLRFNGPLNNPALDIVAMRRGTEVEAGVAVRGTVLVPRITLVSEPSVADAAKLSWLVLGKGLDATTGSDVGALQAAAATLLSQGAASGVQSQLASAFGLENFSIGKSSDSLQQRIVTLGKQVSARLYVSYEQGLASASSVLHLRYTLSPRFTIEAEAGTRSALSLFYNILFD